MAKKQVKGINGDRVMREIVALDCWHSPFDKKRVATLCAHASFAQATYTTRSQHGPISFTVDLAEARLAVVIPDAEPLTVDQETVFAPASAPKIKKTVQQTEKHSSGYGGEAAVGINGTKPVAKLKLTAKGGQETSFSETSKAQYELGPIKVRAWHHDGHYSWKLTPNEGRTLDGEPWDRTHAIAQIFRTDSATNRLDTAVYVEVQARRQHINIQVTAFKPEQASFIERALGEVKRNNLAAAEACLRHALFAEGLDVEGFDDDNAFITFARVQAAEKEDR
jgi:hypothetical protein